MSLYIFILCFSGLCKNSTNHCQFIVYNGTGNEDDLYDEYSEVCVRMNINADFKVEYYQTVNGTIKVQY